MTDFASFYKGRRVVVTGADGFIGSHLTEALANAGADVVAFVQYNPFGRWGWLSNSPIEDQVTILPGDIRDMGRVEEAVKGADTVFHLAALIGIPYSYVAPESYVQTNVNGSYNVGQASLRADVRRMVHTSTSEVYGTARTVPISETHPLQPQSPYSASKIGGDMMVLSLHNSFELPAVVARPFNTFGPRQSTRAVIPTVITQLLRGESELRLGDISPTRDFNYVTDTVNGFLALGACDEAIGQVVNIGTGTEISVGDTVKLLIKITGVDAKIITDESRIRPAGSEVHRLLADNTKITKLTNWSPKYSVEDGLRETVAWTRENLEAVDTSGYSI